MYIIYYIIILIKRKFLGCRYIRISRFTFYILPYLLPTEVLKFRYQLTNFCVFQLFLWKNPYGRLQNRQYFPTHKRKTLNLLIMSWEYIPILIC